MFAESRYFVFVSQRSYFYDDSPTVQTRPTRLFSANDSVVAWHRVTFVHTYTRICIHDRRAIGSRRGFAVSKSNASNVGSRRVHPVLPREHAILNQSLGPLSAIITQALALFAEVLRMSLALIGHVQSVRFLDWPLKPRGSHEFISSCVTLARARKIRVNLIACR